MKNTTEEVLWVVNVILGGVYFESRPVPERDAQASCKKLNTKHPGYVFGVLPAGIA